MRFPVVAALAVSLLALLIWTGCGDTFRPVATPVSGPAPIAQNRAFAAVLSAARPDPSTGLCSDGSTGPCPGAVSQIDVSGDMNLGNQVVGAQTADPANSGFVTRFKLAMFGQEVFLVNSVAPQHSLSSYYPTVASTFTTVGLPNSIPVAPTIANFTLPGSSSATSQVYVAGYDVGQVFVLTSAGSVMATLTVGTNPIAMTTTAAGDKVYVVNQGSSNVTVISSADNTLNPLTGGPISVGTRPVFALTNPNSGLIYVLNGDASISTIDPTTDKVVSTATPAKAPSGAAMMAFNPTLNRLYVPNTNTNNVTVYGATGQALTELSNSPVTVGTAPLAVAPLPDGTRAYVVNSGDTTGCSGEANSGRVSVITAISNSVSCVTVGQTPVWIAASSDGSKVYVPHQGVNLTASPSIIPGTTIIGTTNNLVVNDVSAPAANSEACIANAASCNYMIPFFVASSK